LGGMLLSKDAIADVLERLRPGDFYRPGNQLVYDAVLDLYSRGGHRRDQGVKIWRPTDAANAGYYAEIVAEKSLLRRLVEAGTRVVQYGYAGADGADVND
ncbi:replicative DNA helicase, partial [Mycobacterium sp. ITM-2017-0098]